MSGNYFDRFDEAPKEAPKKGGSNYFDRFDAKPAKRKSTLRDVGEQYLAGLGEGAAGVADMLLQATPVGVVGNMLKTAAGTAEFMSGRGGPQVAPAPVSVYQQQVTRSAPQPQTGAGRVARAAGQMTPNAAAPGSVAARVANVALPTAGSEVGGRIGAQFGERGEAIGRAVGAVAGGAAASARVSPQALRRPEPAARVRGQDVNALRQRVGEYREAGIDPTLVDVVDDAGRGTIKAAANRNTPGRQVANDFARTRSLNLPDRMSQQARRNLSTDPRTPDEIRSAMAAQRSQNAEQAFGAVRGDTIPLAEETVSALRTDYGRRAITEAASRERNPEIRAALNRLANDVLDQPGQTQITIGMADRISRVLNGQAQAAGRSGDRELAGLLGGLAENVRDPARHASTGYRAALEGYSADSRLQEAAGVGEDLLRRNTDEFRAMAGNLGPEERQLALAAARRAVERSSGENASAAPGVARKLADAPEQQARNAALMGQERAGRFQDAMRLEARAVENAGSIAPSRGSPTFLNAADDAQIEGAVRIGQQLVRRDILGIFLDRWRSRGINDQEAEALVRIATDPARLDEAVEIIARRMGQEEARQFLDYRNALLIGGVSSAAAAP